MTQQYFDQNLKIFALNSNRPLAEKIAKHVGVDLGKLSVNRFSDGEIQINIEESVRGDNVYVIQSTSAPVNDNLMELLIMVDALRRASAKTINVVMPYYGYARHYGSPTPINQIAAVAVAEARILTITPWDRQMLKPISKAIQTSDIGINPIDDGQVIRLVFPAPTEERRKQLTKDVQKLGEEAKIAVRNVRRDAMDKFKAMKKGGELTEDDQKKLEEETQKLTDKYVKMIDDTCAAKNKEIMEV